jgi:hypothetical protein
VCNKVVVAGVGRDQFRRGLEGDIRIAADVVVVDLIDCKSFVHFFSPIGCDQVTVEVIIQISKQFATPFWAFFAKLGKSPKKVAGIATSLNFDYPMGVSRVAPVGIKGTSNTSAARISLGRV